MRAFLYGVDLTEVMHPFQINKNDEDRLPFGDERPVSHTRHNHA